MTEPHNPNKRKWERPTSSNVDSSLLEKLAEIVNSKDEAPLIKFIESSSLSRILSNWSYFALVNDQSQFIDISLKLSQVTHRINSVTNPDTTSDPNSVTSQLAILNLKPQIIEFYKSILNDHIKVVYRALNNYKPSLTNPTLRILTNMIEYDASIAIEFLNTFDLTLTILPKLLLPGKNDNAKKGYLPIRATFIRFWIALLSKAPSHHRQDLLVTNVKIMNNWWKFMFEADSIETLELVIEFIDTKILKEPNFRRSIKCKILNENFMHKIQLIFNRNDNETFSAKFTEFMEVLATDSKIGLVYPVEKLWQSQISTGVDIQLNNKTFKIHNKLIYTLLTTLKPWENNGQLQFVVKILKLTPELVPAYMNWMIQHGGGYHDPTLTSWWVGHTLLYTHIIQLPIPQQILKQVTNDSSFISQEHSYDSKTVSDNICLAPLSKQALTKCLETNKLLITQFTLQLIVFILQKLDEVLKSGIITNRQELIDLTFYNLPDLSNIIQVYSKNPDSKLIKLTLLMIINLYEKMYPKAASSALVTKVSSNGINEVIKADLINCTGYDLTLLNHYLSIQSNQDQEQDLKWWNKPNDGNSFFTCLIRLASSAAPATSRTSLDESLVWRLSNLLSTLTDNKLLFNKDLIASPILALIYASSDYTTNITIWNFLDEVISRTIRTPYKYLDLAHEKYNDVSLFVVAIYEQFKFVLKNNTDDTVLEWLFKLSRYLIVIGESKDALISIMKDYLVNESGFKENFQSLELDDTVEQSGNSFVNYITNISNKELVKKSSQLSKRTILSKFDLAGLITRLKLIVNDSSINKVDDLLVELVSKLGNFLLASVSSDAQLYNYMVSKHFWTGLTLEKQDSATVSGKKLFVGGLLNEVFQQLPGVPQAESYLNTKIYQIISGRESYSTEQQLYFAQFAWILSDSQIRELSSQFGPNQLLTLKVCEYCLERDIKVGSKYFRSILSCEFDKTFIVDKQQILSRLVESNLVELDENIVEEIENILSSPSNHYLLKSLINSSISSKNEVINYLIGKSETINDENLLCYIGYSICSVLETIQNSNLEMFFIRITKIATNLLESENIEQWAQLLTILANGLKYIGQEESEIIIGQVFVYVEKVGLKNSMLSEFASFILGFIQHSKNINSEITSWIHKSMLYITKKFAESPELSSNFDSFLKAIALIVQQITSMNNSVWKLIPVSIINTQLEVILNHPKWVNYEKYLEYVNLVIMTGQRSTIQYEKLLQIFINNPANELNSLPNITKARFYSALIIHNLFHYDVSKNSSVGLLEKIALFYLGSIRCEDLLLKTIFVEIESKIATSWVYKVTSWEFSEELTNNEIELTGEGEKRLVEKDKSSLTICLSKRFINNTIKNGARITAPVHIKGESVENSLSKLNEWYSTNEIMIDQSYQNTIYDTETLLMLLIHNDEFVKIEKDEEGDKISFDLKSLIESNMLQVIIVGLSSPSETVKSISSVLLQRILKNLEVLESFKDKNIFKVYISNILNTVRNKEQLPNIIWYVYSSLVPILSNPGHYLYEKAYRYVLSNPSLSRDIPLYKSIIHSQTSSDSELENDESYYKQLVWLLEQFVDGITGSEDINLFKFKGVFEWVMNLTNSPFITMKIKSLIFKFLYIIQNIDHGSDVLITRFGILTSLEQIMQNLDETLLDEQLKLNLKQVVLRFGVSEGSSKRIRDWTGDDLGEYLGKIAHYSFDLVLISIVLAGIHRNTGLVFDTSSFSSVDFRRWFGNYLAFGERCYDTVVSGLRMSGYFKQRNLVYDYVQREAGKFVKEQTGRDIGDLPKADH
ncbi:uncharacterized protein CANTADRAFT_7951 [Suhomyces tanzawaensis NRRL Y-17324]|uniref:Nucleolar pre-ribosomal-associated protein 1 n=1 Tax=Suhomyces tanzawaensis NRRL Y-17324 TaxID=984487 RepID=A0A1E4SD98_9ASCO|nr:uncharacterized protein CANTADRAFT_7951 [Suhomyces tanzawaensis NRRL Y-17324]ODV77490.1 hypothetical protein CANTADRAFT_7951 [Suhomyces tanzawaensis NRRL Y-17324]